MIPIGNIYVGLLIDMTSVGGAEKRGADFVWLKLIVGPLSIPWIVSEKSHGRVVLVEDRDAAFSFRDYRIVSVEAYLTRATKMLRYGSHEITIQIQMAKAPILAITYKKKRLIVACVDCQAMTTVK